MVDPLNDFLFQSVLHNWCNKAYGMCYPVCGILLTKELLLLIAKSSPCGGIGFPLSLSEWSFTIISHKLKNVLNVLNKTFHSSQYNITLDKCELSESLKK